MGTAIFKELFFKKLEKVSGSELKELIIINTRQPHVVF